MAKKKAPKKKESKGLSDATLEEILEEVKGRGVIAMILPGGTVITLGETEEEEEEAEAAPEAEPEPEPDPEEEEEEEVEVEVGTEVSFEDTEEGTLAGTVSKIDGETYTVDVEEDGDTYEYAKELDDLTVAEEPEEEGAEAEPEAEEEEEVEVVVGTEVTFEDTEEGTLAGTVAKIKDDVYTVDVEEDGETYEYEKALDDLNLPEGEEEEEEPEEGKGTDWDSFHIDNLGLTKTVKTKLEKAGYENIGDVQEGVKKPKGFKKKTKLTDPEMKAVQKALEDLE